MRKIAVSCKRTSKHVVKDCDGKSVEAFLCVFDEELLSFLEKAKKENLLSYKIKGKLLTDTGVELAECALEVTEEDSFIMYDGYLGHPAKRNLNEYNHDNFQDIAIDFQEELDLSK